MAEVMSLKHGFSLVVFILLCHNVVLQYSEEGESSNGIEVILEKGESSSDTEVPMETEEGDSGEEKSVKNEEAKSGEEKSVKNEEAKSGEKKSLPKEDDEEEKPPQTEESLEEESSSKETEEHKNFETKPATFRWPSGTVRYHIKRRHYDDIIAARIRVAMHEIERSSCVVFKDVRKDPEEKNGYAPWLSIENPEKRRECTHTTLREVGSKERTKAILTLGYDCMQYRDILHALLHALGFADEVTHPQRDKYVRIVWPNIKPEYRPLFYVKKSEIPQKMVEYDSMSVMHFHDRAYTVNGKATIIPQIPGLLIAPSDTLSQLDVMKLRLTFGHVCNKRKVSNLLRTCRNALKDDDQEENYISGSESEENYEEGTD